MNETIGNRIQKYRKEKGMTQETLAEKLGVSAQAVSKWETDVSCPDITLLPELCRVLGITSDTLLTGNNNEVHLLPPEQRKELDCLTMRILVNSSEGDRVRVNLPMSLVKIGLEIGMLSIPAAGQEVGALLKNIDLDKIVSMVEHGLIGKLVEVESGDGDTVEIVVE